LDIFYPETTEWQNVGEEFFIKTNNKCCLALARTEYVNENFTFRNEVAWTAGEFCDSWIIKLPIKLELSDFIINGNPIVVPLGNAPTCDNIMFEILEKKYEVFNWADKYIAYHYDIVRKPMVNEGTPGPMIYNDKTVQLNHEMQYTRAISPYQNWEEIFDKIINNE
jgi:hypothetical protein